MEATQQPAGTARGRNNKRTGGPRKGGQCNNQLNFCRTTTLIVCGVAICRAAMALPGILVCHAAMAIRGIAFGHAATATARNRAMAKVMAVALEKEGDGEG